MNILQAGQDFLKQAIEIAVMRKDLDTQKAQGKAAVALIEDSNIQNIERPRLRQSSELGQLLDIYA